MYIYISPCLFHFGENILPKSMVKALKALISSAKMTRITIETLKTNSKEPSPFPILAFS